MRYFRTKADRDHSKPRAHQCFNLVRPFCFLLGIACGILSWQYLRQRSGPTESSDPRNIAVFRYDVYEGAFLFVAVLSYQQNEALRDAARRTWLKRKVKYDRHRFPLVYRFFVGSLGVSKEQRIALEREALVHRDLVLLEGVPDSFDNRTFKVLQAFLWVHSNYKCKFLLKVNDNSFAMLDLIVSELGEARFNPRNDLLLWGFFAGYAPVSRSGPWAEPVWFLSDRYLPYPCGGGYVLTWMALVYISHIWKLLDLYTNDDVAVGVWLAPLTLNRRHDRRFDTERESRGCFNSYLVTHRQTASMMEEKYKNLVERGVMCREEVQLRMSYQYDQHARLSQCCVRNVSDIRMPKGREKEKERQGG